MSHPNVPTVMLTTAMLTLLKIVGYQGTPRHVKSAVGKKRCVFPKRPPPLSVDAQSACNSCKELLLKPWALWASTERGGGLVGKTQRVFPTADFASRAMA